MGLINKNFYPTLYTLKAPITNRTPKATLNASMATWELNEAMTPDTAYKRDSTSFSWVNLHKLNTIIEFAYF